jgi:hypothetical protein
MKCKHCGLAIRSQNLGPVVVSYIHLASISTGEMVTCAYANTKGATFVNTVATDKSIARPLSKETLAKYPIDKCRAAPESINSPDDSFLPFPTPKIKPVMSTVVRELPLVTGRKFR